MFSFRKQEEMDRRRSRLSEFVRDLGMKVLWYEPRTYCLSFSDPDLSLRFDVYLTKLTFVVEPYGVRRCFKNCTWEQLQSLLIDRARFAPRKVAAPKVSPLLTLRSSGTISNLPGALRFSFKKF